MYVYISLLLIAGHKGVVLTAHYVEIAGHRDVVSGALYGDCGAYGRLC